MTDESTDLDHQEQVDPPASRPRWRRAFVATSVLLGLIAAGITVFPVVVRETALRDSLLNSSLESAGLLGKSERITGGWMTPITLHAITITDPNGHFRCSIQELQTSSNLTDLLTGNADRGKVVVKGARLSVMVDEEGNWPIAANSTSGAPELDFEILDSHFVLAAPWRSEPIVDLAGIDLRGRIRQQVTGQKQLVVDECLLLDHVTLPPDATAQNMSLIAPILAQSTHISGTASVRLNETVIPLNGQTPEIYVSGQAVFHALDARLKQDWVQQLAAVVGRATNVDVPGRITVARDSVVSFQVHRGGIHHDGMAFLLPELAGGVVGQTSGTIGLDESLDLDLAIQIPDNLQPADPILSQFVRMLNGPLRAKVKGTVSVPRLEFATPNEMLGRISESVHPASHSDEPPGLPSAIFNLVRKVSAPEEDKNERAAGIAGGIIGLIRSIESAGGDDSDQPEDQE